MRLRISQQATAQFAVLALVVSAVNLVLLAIIALQLTVVLNRYKNYRDFTSDYIEAFPNQPERKVPR